LKEHKFGAILSYVNLALTNITGLLLTPFIIKMLGDSEYGLYTLIGAFVGYLSVLDLGLNNAIIRFVAQYRVQNDSKSQENFLAISLVIYTFIGLLITFFGLLFYFNLDTLFHNSLSSNELRRAKIMLLILIFNIAITLPGGAFTGICSGYEKFIFPRFLSITKVVIRSIAVILILKNGADAIGIVLLDTIVNLLFIIVTIYYTFFNLKVKIKLHEWKFYYVKEIFQYSFWIFVFALVYQFQWRTGQVILGSTTNTTIVAIFGVGVMLGVYFTTFGNIINGLLLPKAVQAVYNKVSNEVLTDQMIKFGRISYFLLIYVFGAFFLTGQDFIKLWIGELYLPAYWIALIIMMVYIIPIAQGYSHAVLEAKKMLRFKSLNFLLFSFIGALSGYLLSKNHGMYGMIVGLASGVFLLQIVMNLYYQLKLKLNVIKFFKAILKISIFTILLIIICNYFFIYFNQLTWSFFLLKNAFFSFSFFLLSYIFLTKEEKKYFFQLKMKP
jgi:O-antigen/teichoic acid export membrane protein